MEELKEQKKRRQSISSEVDSSGVRPASTGTRDHCTKTRAKRSTSGKPITKVTLADRDASQTTLKDYNFVKYSQTTPASTIKTGPNRKAPGRSRKPITALTLADHDASQTTLEDYYSVQCTQTTLVATYPLHAMTPDGRKRIRRCLFPPGE